MAQVAAAVGVKLPQADNLLIAYSGGKDSLATLDLCVRSGKRVECFFMEFIPSMDYTEARCQYAECRWGVKVHRLQHPILGYYLRRGVFCDPRLNCPEIKQNDVERIARVRSGCEWVGYGYKLIDSPSRRSYMTFMSAWCSCGLKPPQCQCKPRDGICNSLKRFSPVMNWTNRDVFAYLTRKKIQIPSDSDGRVNGIALIPSVMAYMREHWPSDYQRILKVFPYAAAQADRHDPNRKDLDSEIRVSRNPASVDSEGTV